MLAGNPLSALSLYTQVAFNNFKRRPVAVIVGGGYDDEHINLCVRLASVPAEELSTILVLRSSELITSLRTYLLEKAKDQRKERRNTRLLLLSD